MTEFVGSPASLTAQKSLPPKSRTGSPNMSEAQASITVLMMSHWTHICQSLSQLLRPSQRPHPHPHVPTLHFKHLHSFLLLAL
jgi:hypothetical protein